MFRRAMTNSLKMVRSSVVKAAKPRLCAAFSSNAWPPKKKFCLGGPPDPRKHFMVDLNKLHAKAENGLQVNEMLELVNLEKYFTVYGQWQSSKTSHLMALQNRLNEDPNTVCILASCQGA